MGTHGSSWDEASDMALDIVDSYITICLRDDEDPTELHGKLPKGEGWRWVYPSPKTALAWQIRRLRRTKGLTQSQVADAMKVTQESFTRWENPKTLNPTVATITKVAKALGARLKIELEPVQ